MKYKFSNVKIGIAPIAWTNDDIPELGKENSFEQSISEMALAGFQGTEIGGAKFPKDPKILKPYLKVRKLEIASAWFSSFILKEGLEKTLEEFKKHVQMLKEMGAKVVVVSEQSKSIQGLTDVPVFSQKPILEKGEATILYKGLNELGKYSKSQGLDLVYHHHMGTIIQTYKETVDMLKGTNPEYVSLIFDTGHFSYTGEDISKIVKELAPRIKHVHLKSIRKDIVDKVKRENLSFLNGVRLGSFTIPGDGDVNYDKFFEVLSKHGYQGWFLVEAEQDPAKANPFVYALKAMKFIKEKIEVI
ncbi:inosose dehydratase [Mycoplasma testudineum]|uniref:Inosose dehydratase n=1 Tax=Mycoplasma testudineum TaxID=244584 RepID=A0A4R6I9V7_9MOLU|nr:myo-inosose-2 dehydratase [Mycoplasma testudineum]OYD26477.1 myo-inosose-2 dehydratase [Mycoplasma testudineum]TDO18960.1 inosose dehydratase [Mycoplasma testudineum]